MKHENAEYRILFVCLGNICRSPAAEAVMNTVLEKRGLTEQVHVDSAGTADYHIGKAADPRMIRAGTLRRHKFNHRARQITEVDLEDFDLILAMDESNLVNIRHLTVNEDLKRKVKLFLEHCNIEGCREVPDPYYGGLEGFEQVLDLLEEGCERLADQIQRQMEVRQVG